VICLAGDGVKRHHHILPADRDAGFSQDRREQRSMHVSADFADGGDLSGIIDDPPRQLAAAIDNPDITESGVGEEQSIEVTHNSIFVNEGVIDTIIIGCGIRITDDLAGVIDRVGVTVHPAQSAEVNVVGSRAAKKRRMESRTVRDGAGADNLARIIDA
jgi:hypothetical protein